MKYKTTRIIIDLVLIILGIIFLIFGIKDAIDMVNSNKVPDNVTFSRTYSEITEDNIYRYTDLKNTNKLLSEGTQVLLIGKKTDPWMHILVNPLNEFTKKYISIIYYLELDNLDINDKNYQDLNQKIQNIESPTIVLIKNGKILRTYYKNDIFENDYEDAPIEYFTEERISSLEEKLKISDLK